MRAARLCVAESQAGQIVRREKESATRARGYAFARQELGHLINSVIKSALAGSLSAAELSILLSAFSVVKSLMIIIILAALNSLLHPTDPSFSCVAPSSKPSSWVRGPGWTNRQRSDMQ